MSREREGYREQLASLHERFPDSEAISLSEVCKILDDSDRDTILKTKGFPLVKLGSEKNGKWISPITGLARWLAGTNRTR